MGNKFRGDRSNGDKRRWHDQVVVVKRMQDGPVRCILKVEWVGFVAGVKVR